MKKKRTFMVEVTEQSIVPYTKKENMDDWGFVMTCWILVACGEHHVKAFVAQVRDNGIKVAMREGGEVCGGNQSWPIWW